MSVNTLGTLYIIAAPSGGGKTSLVKRLLEQDSKLSVSTSHTTRAPRHGEIAANDYFFVNLQQFQDMINRNEFIEYALVFNNYYGTSKQQITNQLAQGLDIILEIDWQGARQIRQQFTNVVSIFILPPAYDILEQRLRLRKQDDDAVINARMAQAKQEISHCHEFDYVLFNSDFEQCLAELQAIITTQRLRYSQQLQQNGKLLSKLLENK